MKFDGYFLVVWDIVNAARERSIPVGPGRGPGRGAWSATLSASPSIDPIENGLIFERLLNPERVSMPDIDVDFCDETTAASHRLRRRKNTARKTSARSSPSARMAARAVVRDVGRVLKVPYGEVDKLAKMIRRSPGRR